MNWINLSNPEGTAWELLAAVVVVIAAPILVERIRIPGLIGLLAGGCIIGPNVLGVVSATDGVLHELGEVGLLYLMFVAGLELDLGVFARYKRQAIGFSVLTSFIPAVLGAIVGLAIGYSVSASILLGSLFASYTLVVYPTVRNMGLAANGAVATTVGATVITDTMALVVLAVIAGSATGDASGPELASQVVIGLAILAAYCFLVLPRVAKWFFAGLGAPRTLRYVFVLAALLSGGTLAEMLGIEAIVGAFFSGLALNRLVPNEGEFMERIEFFGSALLIPMFLVSVGTVIDPKVLVDPATLGVAGLFVAACIGGKVIAAGVSGAIFKFSLAEVGVVFGLSVAQAAATLAATFVGLSIGLFTTTTVNAVMGVVVVSLVLASLAVQRFGPRVPKPAHDATRIGRCVLTHADDPVDVASVYGVASRLADADAGVVHPIVVVPDGQDDPPSELLEEIEHTVTRLGIDAELSVRNDRTTNDGILHAASSSKASVLVIAAATQSWLPTLLGAAQHPLIASARMPTVLVRGGTERPTRAVLVLSSSQAKRPATATQQAVLVAERLSRSGLPLVVVAGSQPDSLLTETGDDAHITIMSPLDWVASDCSPADILILPGGRNGAIATARTVRAATTQGCTIAVVADRESVSATERAAQGLGLVTAPSTPAADLEL